MNKKASKTKNKIKASAKARKIYKIIKQIENEIFKMTPKQKRNFSKQIQISSTKTKVRSGAMENLVPNLTQSVQKNQAAPAAQQVTKEQQATKVQQAAPENESEKTTKIEHSISVKNAAKAGLGFTIGTMAVSAIMGVTVGAAVVAGNAAGLDLPDLHDLM